MQKFIFFKAKTKAPRTKQTFSEQIQKKQNHRAFTEFLLWSCGVRLVQPPLRARLQADGLAESTPKKQLILSEGAVGAGVV